MQIRKNNLLKFLVLALFVVSPFVMSYENEDKAELISAQMLPVFISNIASTLRWGILGLILIIAIFRLQQNRSSFKISIPVLFISLFYLIQFLVALVNGIDYIRFLLMTIFCLFISPVIGQTISDDKQIIKYFTYSIASFLIVSIILNGHLVLIGERFFGFMNNANLYGISTVFWMIILLLAEKYELINKRFFIILFLGIFLTMIFSGSRNAMVGMFLILLINYYNRFNKLVGWIMIFFIAFFIISHFIDLSFVTGRLLNIFDATADSGREAIWKQSYAAINQNLWFGNGMDANLRIANTSNMHNCYIRFVLNMGMFFTILILFIYFIFIVSTYLRRKNVPLVLVGYLIVFALMNIGEDFFVGLGSSVFVYFLFINGFINCYITDKNDIVR